MNSSAPKRSDFLMSVIVPRAWADELQRMAHLWGIPRSELVRKAVDMYIARLTGLRSPKTKVHFPGNLRSRSCEIRYR